MGTPMKSRLTTQQVLDLSAKRSPDVAEMSQLDSGAGIGTLDRDQARLGNFLGYRRFHGMAFRYAGKRDPRFTHDAFNETGEPSLHDSISSSGLNSKRYAGRAALTDLHEFRRSQRCQRHALDESCRLTMSTSSPQLHYNTNDISIND